jgi:sporulation integral membrane protein YlbJ
MKSTSATRNTTDTPIRSMKRKGVYPALNYNTLAKILIVLFFAAMFLFPGASFRGAGSGLLLWFHNVLPSVLPFIILSNLITRLNIAGQISKILYPLLGRLMHISYEGCYPVIIGFLSGLPIGAKSTADLVHGNKISLKEGQFLMGMCNNASPMFIIGYIALTQLKLPDMKYALFAIIYGSAVIGAFMYQRFSLYKINTPRTGLLNNASDRNAAPSRFTFDLLDQSIMNGFEIITKIGGYIILFSMLAQIIREIGPQDSFLKAFVMGILEITTGISQICSSSMNIHTKIVLVSILTSFGGLSAAAQTKSVLGDTGLSMKAYLLIKLMSAFTALILSVTYLTLFRIGN